MSLPRDFWIGLVVLAGAVLYWLGAEDIPISPLDGAVNASAMPKMLAMVLGLLAVLLMTQSMLKRHRTTKQTSSGDQAEDKAARTNWSQHGRALGLVGIGAAYLVVLPVLGYWIGVALLLGATALYMGATFGLRLMAMCLALATCFYLLFVKLLHIQLPVGLIGSLFS